MTNRDFENVRNGYKLTQVILIQIVTGIDTTLSSELPLEIPYRT